MKEGVAICDKCKNKIEWASMERQRAVGGLQFIEYPKDKIVINFKNGECNIICPNCGHMIIIKDE